MPEKTIQLLDKTFALYIPESRIREEVKRLAGELKRDLAGRNPLFLGILNGAFMFAADLFRELSFPVQISFLRLASYSGTRSRGAVKQLIGIHTELRGRLVVVLEDIVDTGITLEAILRQLNGYHPEEIRVVTLLHKSAATVKKVKMDYTGMTIPDDFVVGYGLDYEGYGRNFREIYRLLD